MTMSDAERAAIRDAARKEAADAPAPSAAQLAIIQRIMQPAINKVRAERAKGEKL